ncbi:G2/mitotic-specific cyclin S13-7-like [Gastrolobium bilobum]|uniref:G2/mitotic-specific cyclin S13-7-like n=1 Tax=Gastrolobium bilobum TaxID=150636 RepID=UPI002AAF4FF0|nr:G2/mitotic-specific cyclin S13-7-like [Gastrolobium bilobum]
MENRARGKGKVKEGTWQGNRQVLGDIGNVEVLRIADGKQISRPITRSFHAKLLAEGHKTPADWVLGLEVQTNEQAPAQGKKKVIVPVLDNKAIAYEGVEDLTHKPNPEPVDVVSSEAGEKIDFVLERKSRERSSKKVKSLTSQIITQSKAACGILIVAEDQQPVDVDADVANDELAVVEYIDDIYKFYKLTEDEIRLSDYMKSQHEITEKMRSIIVDWLVEVHMRFELMPETLYLTINIIDRYLSLTVVPKNQLQLVGISSMLIACKYEKICTPRVNDFISISDNAYTKNQIISMETEILEKLEWYLTVPTPYVFLVRLIRASVPPDQEMENMVFFLAELGLVHYQAIILYCPSLIAAAAVYAARCTLKRCPFWSEILKNLAGYCTEQIIDCAMLLVSLHARAADSKLQAVYQKFLSLDRGAVSLLSPTEDIVKNS